MVSNETLHVQINHSENSVHTSCIIWLPLTLADFMYPHMYLKMCPCSFLCVKTVCVHVLCIPNIASGCQNLINNMLCWSFTGAVVDNNVAVLSKSRDCSGQQETATKPAFNKRVLTASHTAYWRSLCLEKPVVNRRFSRPRNATFDAFEPWWPSPCCKRLQMVLQDVE